MGPGIKGLKRAGIRDHSPWDLESQRVGSGSAVSFMESGIKFLRVQGSRFSSFLESGIIHTYLLILCVRDTIQDAKRSNGSDGSKLKAT